MPRVPAVLLSLILGAASAVLISCGSSGGDSIPATSADAMLAQLQRARDGKSAGECDKVASAAGEVQRLAASVQDGDVRIAIQKGAANLSKLSSDPSACQTTTEKTTTTSEPTTTEPPSTTTSTTKPPTTTKSTTTTRTTTTTKPEPPPPPPGGGTGGGTKPGGK